MSTLGLASTSDDGSPDPREVEGLRRRLRRLALDVHDGPMQSLIAAGFGLSDLKRHANTDVAGRLDEIAFELAGAERALRNLITTLEQSGTDELEPLEELAAAEVDRFRRGCPIDVELTVRGDAHADSHSQEIAIRSILREALTNVSKHANAASVRVEIDARPSGLTLSVEDDGDGFDPAAVSGDRIGLTSMRERIQFLGGTFSIESAQGGPTVVTATFRRWRRT